MCQALRTDLVSPPRNRFMKPRLFRWSSSCASSYRPVRISRNTLRIPNSTTRLRIPSTQRKTPETEAPMTPVTECSSELSFSTWPGERLHPDREQERQREHDRGVAEGEPEPDRERLADLGAGHAGGFLLGVVGHQLARGVVDRRDVVGVERVPQPERVREDADADREDRVVTAEVVVVRHHEAEQDAEADDVQQDDEPVHPAERGPVAPGQAAAEPGEPRGVHGRGAVAHRPDLLLSGLSWSDLSNPRT